MKLASILSFLFVACFAGDPAYATNYTISFTTAGNPAPTSGSFDWDGNTFSNFNVVWDGLTFDLTAKANSPRIIGGACGSGVADAFTLLTTPGICSTSRTGYPDWQGIYVGNGTSTFGFYDVALTSSSSMNITVLNNVGSVTPSGNSAVGTWSTAITGSATPESGTISLTLAGLAVLLAGNFNRRKMHKP